VTVTKSNVSFIDQLIAEEANGQWGIPFGQWIQLTGKVGSGKTTLGVQLLDGFSKNPDVEIWHCDFEMREPGARRLYKSIGAKWNPNFAEPEFPLTLLTNIYTEADRLALLGRKLVVLVDAFQSLIPSRKLADQIKLAERIKNSWKDHPNLLLITVNHLNKAGQVGGAAQVAQWGDVIISVQRKYGFTYLESPKNRCQAPGAWDVMKLTRQDGLGFVPSAEPDFISSMGLVVFVRDQLAKQKRPTT